jgi:citronellol/citronellal dehydrogenase
MARNGNIELSNEDRSMNNLSGKTLFITGASRGIGRAIALRAARDGANIAIASKSDVANPKLPGTG